MKIHEKTMTATEFKAKCLSLLENLGPRGIIITKRGKSVARVIPLRAREKESLVGCMRGKIRIKGDIFSTGASWDAES